MKRAYYYLYYTIYKAWSKNYNPLLSNNFRADISLMAIKTWFVISIFAYLSLMIGTKIRISALLGIVIGVLVIGSTLYFFTFSDKWKPYFEEFEKLSKQKKQVGGIIIWSVIILTFVNFIVAVNLMKSSLS